MDKSDGLKRLQVRIHAKLVRKLKVYAAVRGKTLREALEFILESVPEIEHEHKPDMEKET